MADPRGMKRQLLIMIGLVTAIDAVAVAILFLGGIRGRGQAVQLLFAVVWTVAILAVVVGSMRRIREARKSANSEK
jgi:hypothetical protein